MSWEPLEPTAPEARCCARQWYEPLAHTHTFKQGLVYPTGRKLSAAEASLISPASEFKVHKPVPPTLA